MYIAVKHFRANGRIIVPGEQVDVTGWNGRRVSALVKDGNMAVGPLEVMSETEHAAITEDPNKVYAVFPDPV